jgi:hypothetical protein
MSDNWREGPTNRGQQMVDVHAPYEIVHTWKSFLIHIATIVIGLLIAIGLEQTVESFHHRHQAREARRRLLAEVKANGEIARNDASAMVCGAMTNTRNGDASKNSASDPRRSVLRSHSLASTTTAVRRPFRVIVWGPCVSAFSMTSPSFALACTTVQMPRLRLDPSLNQRTLHTVHGDVGVGLRIGG